MTLPERFKERMTAMLGEKEANLLFECIGSDCINGLADKLIKLLVDSNRIRVL